MTAPLRQWCNDSRLLREEFAEATMAANQLCNAVPMEVNDELMILLNDIQYELDALPIDQRSISPLVAELNYLIDQLDQLHQFTFPTAAKWQEMAQLNGFHEMTQQEIGQFNGQFPSPPSEYLWRGLWRKGDDGPVFGIFPLPWGGTVGVLLAEPAKIERGTIKRPVVIYEFTPGQQTFRDLFDRPFTDLQDQSYYTDATPFYRDPIPTSSMVAEMVKFLKTGKLSWRRPRNPDYQDKYKLEQTGGIRSWIRSQRTPAYGNAPAGAKSEFERRQLTKGSSYEEWAQVNRPRRGSTEDFEYSQTFADD